MEVASPLPFGGVKAGSKRRFACVPLDGPVEMDAAMDDSAFQGQNYKRRRCDNGEREMSMNHSMSMSSNSQFGGSPFGPPRGHQQILPQHSTSIGESHCQSHSVPFTSSTHTMNRQTSLAIAYLCTCAHTLKGGCHVCHQLLA